MGGMHSQNAQFLSILQAGGYVVVTVAWEDTSRSKGSSVGRNITDMTLRLPDGALCPVVRPPNFADVTFDHSMHKINMVHNGAVTTLYEVLKEMDLLRPQEEFCLAQAQGSIVPKSARGPTEFCPALYNYQSRDGNPAVLVFVITSMGTTMHAPGSRAYKLLMNNNGTLCWYKAEALGDIRGTGPITAAEMTPEEARSNYILVVQVPLKKRAPSAADTLRQQMVRLDDWQTFGISPFFDVSAAGGKTHPVRSANPAACASPYARGADMARVSEGSSTGEPYIEPTGPWIRDERDPVRVTFCSFRVEGPGGLGPADAADFVSQLNTLSGPDRSSLVLGFTSRPTEPVPEDPAAGGLFAAAQRLWGGSAGLFSR